MLIAVIPILPGSVGKEGIVYAGTVQENEKARYQTILETGVRKLADAGLRVRGEVVVGDAVREIADCAHRSGADLIVVGHQHQKQLDSTVVAQLGLQGFNRAGPLQRAGGDHAVKGPGMAHGAWRRGLSSRAPP